VEEEQMRALIWVIVALVVIAVIVLIAVAAMRKRRETELRQRFGPEYERAVERTGSPQQARAQLADVARRRDELQIADLTPQARAGFDEAWFTVQTRFVDEPGQAVTDADGLVTAVMRARGYPVEDFEDRAWLLAADHADVVEQYRQARAAHTRHLQAGSSDTEDLRQAFVHYRVLYGVLSGRRGDEPVTPVRTGSAGAHSAQAQPVAATAVAPVAAPAPDTVDVTEGTDGTAEVREPTVADRVMGDPGH
jgi:hypothetical protein